MSVEMSDVARQVQDNFQFEVVKFPLTGPDNIKTPFYGLFRNDTFEVVNDRSVSKLYVPHQTEDVVALVDAASEVFGEVNVKCHFRSGHYVSVMPSNDIRKSVFGTVDNVFPRIIIRAGYDGKAFKATLGCYRDMCQNLMMLQSVNSTSVSIRHSSGLRGHMDELVQTFEDLSGSWTDLSARIDEMRDRQVNVADFLKNIYGEPKDSKRGQTVHQNRTEAIFKRLLRECQLTGTPRPSEAGGWQVPGWLAYNAVQGYTQHDARRKGGTTDFDRVILASQSQDVLKAEKLVLAV